jgi:general secretion pathway protein H
LANGFTLLEMLVVLAIAGLVSGLGWTQLRGSLARAELGQATASATAALRGARASALLHAGPVSVAVIPARREIRADGAPPVSLAASVRVSADRLVRFYPDGSSTGGTLMLRGRDGVQRIDVAPATGLVSVVRG